MKKQILIVDKRDSSEIVDALMASGTIAACPEARIGKFSSGENFVEFFPKDEKNYAKNAALLQDAHVILVQSTGVPVGDNSMNLLLMAHTAKLYGASEITAILPYKSFDRQDRLFKNRFTSMTADLYPKLLQTSGVDNVVTITPHSQDSIKLYRDVFGDKFTALTVTQLFAAHIRTTLSANTLTLRIGAPDGANKPADEGQSRARDLTASVFNTVAANNDAMFHIAKIHTQVSETKITHFDGDVVGKDCVIIDDMIDGGSTMKNAAKVLKAQGAKSVTCYATHGILSGDMTSGALLSILTEKAEDGSNAIDRLVVTDSLPDAKEKVAALMKLHSALGARVDVLSVGSLVVSALAPKPVIKLKPLSPPSA